MTFEGGRYCGQVRYVGGGAGSQAQRHGRECQDISGGAPQMAINTSDMQPFHIIPEGVPAFEREPGLTKKWTSAPRGGGRFCSLASNKGEGRP